MQETRKGVIAVVTGCVLWGLSPLLYKALGHVPPLEVLSHRTIWALLFFGTYLAVQGRLGLIGAVFKSPALLVTVLICALLISAGWGFFIWAIPAGRTLEISLGYFIYPLMTVVMGALIFRENLGKVQMLSVLVIGAAVALLTWGLGVTPWVSLIVAVLFMAYSLLKKKLPLGPVVSVTAEVLLLTPVAVIWLWGVHVYGWEGIDGRSVGAFGQNMTDNLLLMLLGPMTAVPLVLFTFAAKRLGFATLGLLFYLAPSLQFAVAVLVFGEAVSVWHAIAFPVIWVALVFYSIYALRQEKLSDNAPDK